MAAESGWQSNYVDLSDDRAVRFGGECVVCHAHYVTAPEPLAVTPPPDGDPDPETEQAIENQKYRLFNAFDGAFRSITIVCFRCGNPACPDCWDVDKQMCGACVAQRGLERSPHRGGPVDGPLVDGFLRRAEPGRYSEVGRPAWLKELLRAQPNPDAPRASTLTEPPIKPSPIPRQRPFPSLQPFPSQQPLPAEPGPESALPPDPAEVSYPRAPAIPLAQAVFEPVPTTKMDTPGPPPRSPEPSDWLNSSEGEATSSVVECPRCGAANYDFVTQCNECGLQLIQICPSCERLNPGDASLCQHCGSLLNRPPGWSGVMRSIVPVAPQEARRRMSSGPISPPRVTPVAQAPSPEAWLAGPDEREASHASAAGWAERRPVAVMQEPELTAEPLVGPAFAADPMALRHPYEVNGPLYQPIVLGEAPSALPTRGSMLAGAVGTLLERALTVVVLLGLFAVVGTITVAEASAQANHSLALVLHFDIREQVQHLLIMLHLGGQK